MDALLSQLAESSPIALVAIFSIWRMSIVMVETSRALVEIATAQSDTVENLVDKAH